MKDYSSYKNEKLILLFIHTVYYCIFNKSLFDWSYLVKCKWVGINKCILVISDGCCWGWVQFISLYLFYYYCIASSKRPGRLLNFSIFLNFSIRWEASDLHLFVVWDTEFWLQYFYFHKSLVYHILPDSPTPNFTTTLVKDLSCHPWCNRTLFLL